MSASARAVLKWLLSLAVFPLWHPSAAYAQGAPSRIVSPVDESRRVTLPGNVHPLARREFDRGIEPDSLPLDHMFVLLTRSREQEVALETLLAEQQNPSSPQYHDWLTPEQFGANFGASDGDLQKIEAWLSAQGFQRLGVARGRTVIDFSGNAGLVRGAFHTEIHRFVVNGQEHWANTADPQIPAALAPVVSGIVGLNDFRPRPLHRVAGAFSRSRATGRVEPLFTFTGGICPVTCYAVGPYDFATIYHVLPLWNAGIDGTGQTIAVAGRSNINLQDVRDFRMMLGLPAKDPIVIIPPGSTDPGQTGDDDETEADLDVQWSGGVAKNATIDLVTAGEANGLVDAINYIVQQNLAPIMSVSFGVCELDLGSAGNQFFNALWQQAAAQGMTVLVASGDQGSATCDAGTAFAESGLAVNGIASTPFDTAVGGTDFDDAGNQSQFWNSVNNPITQASAKGYIPEAAWNDSCANPELFSAFGSSSAEQNCNNVSAQQFFLVVAGGGGGASNCTSPTGIAPTTCAGGYAKPEWQHGNGVPNDGKRDVPDVSVFAGDGLNGSFYIICQADQTPDNSCNLKSPFFDFLAIGGTSAASPAFAGIMALVEQKTGSAQGNVNPSLYTLAARQSASGCNSTTGPAGSCVLNDVTAGTNAMPCAAGSPDCLTTNAADSIGVLSGFDASVGYDRATGLGSVNATNLVSKWIVPSAVGQFSVVPNPANVDIAAAGETGAATLVVTGTNGFVGMVSFSCTVSPPAANDSPTCFVFPFSVAINSTTSTTATATLQIKTTSGLSSSARPHHDPGGPTWLLVMASGGLACFVLIGVRRSRQRRVILMMAASLTLLSASLIGCAGGPGGSGQVNLGTPAGNYTATVTATGGGLTQSTTVLVTVQ